MAGLGWVFAAAKRRCEFCWGKFPAHSLGTLKAVVCRAGLRAGLLAWLHGCWICLREAPGSPSGWQAISSWLRISPPGSPSSLLAPDAGLHGMQNIISRRWQSLGGTPGRCVSLSPLRSRAQGEAQFTSANWIWELHFSVHALLSGQLLRRWTRLPILLRNTPRLGWSTGHCQLR